MEKEKYIEQIRQKCIKANPDRNEQWEYDTGAPVGSGYIKTNPCRLADVLLAIMKKMDGKTKEEVKNVLLKLIYLWVMQYETLEAQSEETLKFIFNLLN